MKRWTQPTVRNINCGMEVTSYDSSELEDDLAGPFLPRTPRQQVRTERSR